MTTQQIRQEAKTLIHKRYNTKNKNTHLQFVKHSNKQTTHTFIYIHDDTTDKTRNKNSHLQIDNTKKQKHAYTFISYTTDHTRNKNTKLYFCPKQQIHQETKTFIYSPCDLTKNTTTTITLPSLYRTISRGLFIERRTMKKLVANNLCLKRAIIYFSSKDNTNN